MMNPVLQAIYKLGGSGSNEEINNIVADIMNLTDEQLEQPLNENSTRTMVEDRISWARSYLKKFGLLDNSKRGIWTFKESHDSVPIVDPKEVVQTNQKFYKEKKKKDVVLEEEIEELQWQDTLKNILLNLKPDAFERLSQRILRESGFIQVEVTGKTGDGGIDGKGIIKVGGLISFSALFQCKRYRGTVSASNIRDFRGALQGRADKGLFITTGTFSRDAQKEAQRDGADPIDIIDGDALIEKLRDLELGVKIEKRIVEKINIDKNWFENI